MKTDPIELQKQLKGVDYPATKDDLVSAAEANGAPADVLAEIRSLDATEFESPADVMSGLGSG
jgi:hypothetical protein